MRAFDEFESGKLKGQKLTKKQLMKKPEVKATQFQCLLPLKEAIQERLLQKLIEKEITLKEMKAQAEKEKKIALKTKFLHLTNCSKWEEAEVRFPHHATVKQLEQFLTVEIAHGTPQVFQQFCASAVKWQSTSEESVPAATFPMKCHIVEVSQAAGSFNPAQVVSHPGFDESGASLFLGYLEKVG